VNENDVIRDAILRHLYTSHENAKSPRTAGIKITALNKAMRTLGYKQQQVAHNMDYLIQKGWAREEVETRMFTTARGTTQPSEKRTYKISDVGIDLLEAASMYERPSIAAGINITTIDGVTVVGDGNVVNTTFTDLSTVLTHIRAEVLASSAITDADKLVALADLDALRSQLQKPDPNSAVVATLWRNVERIAAAGGLAELATKAAGLLAPLLG
jgi:hypothetical protein